MKDLLVIRLGALGDLIHVSPSLDAVKAVHPELRIHWVTSSIYADFVRKMLPAVDTVWTLDKRQGWKGIWTLARELKAAGIDGAINLHPAFKTWALIRLLGSIPCAVYRKEKLRAKGEKQRKMPRRHAVTDFYEPFRQLLDLTSNDKLIPSFARPRLQAQDARKPRNERWIGLIVGVGAKRSNRAWPLENYVELSRKLLAGPEIRLLLVGGPDERVLADELLSRLPYTPRLENHAGRHDLPGTVRLLSQCDLVIGGDTGPMHLAAALGIPLVGIYGPTSLDRTGPRGRQLMKLLTAPADLACWPCEQPTCRYRGWDHLRCMREVTVEEVLAATTTLLRLLST